MNSIAFPKMFESARTLVFQDHEATLSNLKLLLASERTSLLGDPYFGTILKRVLFEQNDAILRDLIIDEIYTSIITFMPQIKLERNNIKITSNGIDVFAEIYGVNLIDYTTDMYSINLTNTDEVLG